MRDPEVVGYLYFVRAAAVGMVKIGFSRQHPSQRMIGLPTCCPVEIELIGVMRGTLHDEKRLHARFKEYRGQGEWFREHPALLEFAARKNEEYEVAYNKWVANALKDFRV